MDRIVEARPATCLLSPCRQVSLTCCSRTRATREHVLVPIRNEHTTTLRHSPDQEPFQHPEAHIDCTRCWTLLLRKPGRDQLRTFLVDDQASDEEGKHDHGKYQETAFHNSSFLMNKSPYPSECIRSPTIFPGTDFMAIYSPRVRISRHRVSSAHMAIQQLLCASKNHVNIEGME